MIAKGLPQIPERVAADVTDLLEVGLELFELFLVDHLEVLCPCVGHSAPGDALGVLLGPVGSQP